MKAERTPPSSTTAATPQAASQAAPEACARERPAGSLQSRGAPRTATGLTPRQQALDDLMRGGHRPRPRAVQIADDEALAAGIAASLSPIDARSGLQARIESARAAGASGVRADAMKRANDAALAAGIAASLGAGAPRADPKPGNARIPRPAPGRPASAGAASSRPAAQAEAAPAAKDPYATLGVRKDAPWRVIFGMNGRLAPAVVKSRAAAEGAAGMLVEVAQARKDLAKAYKRRLIPIHPDRNIGQDMRAVLDVVNASLDAGEKELAATERFLARRLGAVAPSA